MDHFNEMFNELSEPRDPYTGYNKWLSQEDMSDLQKKNREAEAVFRRTGITFNVYGVRWNVYIKRSRWNVYIVRTR